MRSQPKSQLRSAARVAVLVLGIPTGVSGYLRLSAVAGGESNWRLFTDEMKDNFVYHAGVVGAVLLVLWIAGRSTHRASLTWRIFGPCLGGLVLTVGWLGDVSSNGFVEHLGTWPPPLIVVIWGLNTVVCLRWWGIAGATAPQRGVPSREG